MQLDFGWRVNDRLGRFRREPITSGGQDTVEFEVACCVELHGTTDGGYQARQVGITAGGDRNATAAAEGISIKGAVRSAVVVRQPLREEKRLLLQDRLKAPERNRLFLDYRALERRRFIAVPLIQDIRRITHPTVIQRETLFRKTSRIGSPLIHIIVEGLVDRNGDPLQLARTGTVFSIGINARDLIPSVPLMLFFKRIGLLDVSPIVLIPAGDTGPVFIPAGLGPS